MSAHPLIVFDVNEKLLDLQTTELIFEHRFGAEAVRHHKPSRQAYVYVEKELGVAPSQHCMIACCTWDTLGAVAAGWEADLIKRVGNDALGVGPQPQMINTDQLVARHRG